MSYPDMAVGAGGGLGVGIMIGVAIDNIPAGIAIGIALGAALGGVWGIEPKSRTHLPGKSDTHRGKRAARD